MYKVLYGTKMYLQHRFHIICKRFCCDLHCCGYVNCKFTWWRTLMTIDRYQTTKKTQMEVCNHHSEVIMGAMASQITSLTSVYSTVYSGANQRKHQSSTSLAFVRRIHRWPLNSPHKRPVTRKMFPFDDVIMECIIIDMHCIALIRLEETGKCIRITFGKHSIISAIEIDYEYVIAIWHV